VTEVDRDPVAEAWASDRRVVDAADVGTLETSKVALLDPDAARRVPETDAADATLARRESETDWV